MRIRFAERKLTTKRAEINDKDFGAKALIQGDRTVEIHINIVGLTKMTFHPPGDAQITLSNFKGITVCYLNTLTTLMFSLPPPHRDYLRNWFVLFGILFLTLCSASLGFAERILV